MSVFWYLSNMYSLVIFVAGVIFYKKVASISTFGFSYFHRNFTFIYSYRTNSSLSSASLPELILDCLLLRASMPCWYFEIHHIKENISIHRFHSINLIGSLWSLLENNTEQKCGLTWEKCKHGLITKFPHLCFVYFRICRRLKIIWTK